MTLNKIPQITEISNRKQNSRNKKQEKIEKEQVLSDVKNLIKFLPSDQKEVLMMRLYYDMSFKEISETTNVSKIKWFFRHHAFA